MIALTVYKKATGEITKSLIVPSTHKVSIDPDEGIISGQYDDTKFVILNEVPVERPVIEISGETPVAQPISEPEIRSMRNNLLQKTDWTQTRDAPVDQDAWAKYRQELRDLTLREGFPSDIVWPTPPEM